MLPLFAKRTRQVRELIPELYLQGLALGDFDLALRGLLGDKAPLSASTVARLKEKWQAEWEVWQSRALDDLEVVYLWVDGVVRHEALCNLVGCKGPPSTCRSRLMKLGAA